MSTRHNQPRRIAAWLLAGLSATLAAPLPAAGASGAPATGNPATASNSASGQALFRRHCGPCHLPGGTGTFMLGRRLGEGQALLEARTNLAADYVRVVVRNGIQSMPRFARPELPDAELARIARYLAREDRAP